jgi:hypothetical protein
MFPAPSEIQRISRQANAEEHGEPDLEVVKNK